MIKSFKALIGILKGAHEPNRHIEKEAKSRKTHPLGGFWKTRPQNNHGLAIGRATEDTYFVSFCGPGGCFEKDTWRPNSPIVGDENYRVLDNDTIEIRSKKGFKKYKRAASREST